MKMMTMAIAAAAVLASGCALFEDPGKRRQQYVAAHPELSATHKADILTGRVRVGMTESQVAASIGRPSDINRSAGSWGTSAQWIYGSYEYPSSMFYLYFRDGRLSSCQDCTLYPDTSFLD